MKWAVVLVLSAGLVFCLANQDEAYARFSNLDRLLTRLGGTTESPEETSDLTTLEPEHHMRRHWAAWLRKNQHEEDEDDDDDEEDEDNEEQEQADTTNSRKPFTTTVSRPFDFKWLNSKRNMDKSWSFRAGPSAKPLESDNSAQNEVYRHNIKMSRETACRIPQLKVVRVSDHYPSSSKVYLPSCTKLHQCAEDTGCCGVSQKCGPKTTKMVELYFYTTYSVSSQGRYHRTTPTIEKLPFYNHTECECQDRADEMPRDTEPHRFDPMGARSSGCRCPSEYTVRYLSNGSCACDCFDKQRDCTKYKKGKEYFNHSDRLCIETGTCTVPTCDFGAYLRRSGRCPRKHEKFRNWNRFHH